MSGHSGSVERSDAGTFRVELRLPVSDTEIRYFAPNQWFENGWIVFSPNDSSHPG